MGAVLLSMAALQVGAATPPVAKPAGKVSADRPAAGFVIERAPAWVAPLAAEPASGLAAAPLQVLLLDRQVRVERAGSTHYFHRVRQVNDASGLQKAGQIEIEFDPSYQKLSLHQLAVWRGGQRLDKLDRKRVTLLHRETQLERQMVDGRMTASIVLDDLRVGDRVEWAGSLTGDNPVFGGRHVDVDWPAVEDGPIGVYQLRLSAPPERAIAHRVDNPAIQAETQLRQGRRETVFRGRNLPQFRFDPLLPPEEYLKQQIEFSEFASWAEVAAWADGLFAKATLASAAVDALAAEIQSRAATPDDRLRAALDFVQQEVRYFGTEIGADSHQPASAEAVLTQRFGDCKDKVALLATLLRRLGFEATPALVSTRYGSRLAQRLPSPLAFDHAIAAVRSDGQTLWLDGTRALQTGAPATRQPVGLGQALLARAGTEALQPLPAAQEALRSETVDTFRFPQLAQEGTLDSVTTYHGDFAEWVRDAQAHASAAEFEKFVVGDTLRAYPTLVLDGPPQVRPVEGRNAVTVSLHYRTGRFWSFPEQRVLVGNLVLTSLAAPLRLPDQTPRTQPLRVQAPGRYLHTVRFEFGEPVYGQPSSSRFDERNAQFQLAIRYLGDARSQVVEGELTQLAERIEPAEWTAHRDRLAKVFQRLASSLTVPVVAPDELDALRAGFAALDQQLRNGQVRAVTRAQVDARLKLMVLDRQLAGGRVPEELRPEVLVARGIQLDHLGRADEARVSFDRAVALAPQNAEAHAALAVNALMRRDDAAADDEAQAALRLAPSDPAPRYTRAWARYFAGDFGAAQAELQEILRSRGEVERSYGGVWLYLATRRQGGDGAAAVQPYLPSGGSPAWPHPVLQWFAGRGDFDAALAATRERGQPDRGRECELYFFAAQKALLDNDARQARAYLQKSLATGVVEFTEYALAQRELDRLGAR